MNGQSAYGWIKAITALAVLALLAFLVYKLLSLFGSLPKFFQGTGKLTSLLGESTTGAPAASDKPGTVAALPNVGRGALQSGIRITDMHEEIFRGQGMRNEPGGTPLSIEIIGGANS